MVSYKNPLFCCMMNGTQKGERRDMEIKEIRDLISEKQKQNNESWEKQKFWDNSGFKIVVSLSMLMLVVVSKR